MIKCICKQEKCSKVLEVTERMIIISTQSLDEPPNSIGIYVDANSIVEIIRALKTQLNNLYGGTGVQND